jgi:glycerophosphoryl diester phosphodiesterase
MKPQLIAHRGDSAHAPENTFPAFAQALAKGADWIELDLALSADGQPVVSHDFGLWRRARRRIRLDQLSADELARVDVSRGFAEHRGASVPSLCDVLDQFGKDGSFYLELKSHGGGRRDPRNRALLEAVLRQVPRRSRHALASFDPGLVRGVLEQGRRAVLILKDPRALYRLDASERSRLFAVSAHHQVLKPGLIRRVLKNGVRLWTWTVDGEAAIRRAWEHGARGFCSNDVAEARAVLDRLAGDPA